MMDAQMLADITEIIMIVTFGFSWPFNVMKSYKARTTKGKSLSFLCLIFFGYIAGIISKAVNPKGPEWFKLVFYTFNFIMVTLDLVMYARNRKLDKKNGVL